MRLQRRLFVFSAACSPYPDLSMALGAWQWLIGNGPRSRYFSWCGGRHWVGLRFVDDRQSAGRLGRSPRTRRVLVMTASFLRAVGVVGQKDQDLPICRFSINASIAFISDTGFGGQPCTIPSTGSTFETPPTLA